MNTTLRGTVDGTGTGVECEGVKGKPGEATENGNKPV